MPFILDIMDTDPKVIIERELLERDEECAELLGDWDESKKKKLFDLISKRMDSLIKDEDSSDSQKSGNPDNSEKVETKVEPNAQPNDPQAGASGPSVDRGNTQTPKIGLFSGDEPLGKGEISYEQWHHEVSCLVREGYAENVILLSIRRSLKSTAASVLVNLGLDISTKLVLEKFNVVFGNVLPSEMLLEDFYTARQGEKESVVAWGCRIERLLMKAKEQGTIKGTEDMARTKFWSGIKDDRVKSALRHKFDTGRTFQELLKDARLLEHEFNSKTVKVNTQSVSESQFDSRLSKLEKMVEKLVTHSNESHGKSANNGKSGVFCRYCKKKGHEIGECRTLKRKNEQKQGKGQQSTQGTES